MDSDYSNVINKITELGDSLHNTKEKLKENNNLIKKTVCLLQDIKGNVSEYKDKVSDNNELLKNTIFLLHGIYTILQSRHDLHKRPYFNDPSARVTREMKEQMLSLD